MASLVSSLKRKLASVLFAAPVAPAASAGEEGGPAPAVQADDDQRPRKRQRLEHAVTPLLVREAAPSEKKKAHVAPKGFGSSHQSSELLRMLSDDVLAHCVSYINTPSDRFGLQVACTTFRELSNAEDMLATLELGGVNALVTNVYSPFEGMEGNENGEEGDALPAGAAEAGEDAGEDAERDGLGEPFDVGTGINLSTALRPSTPPPSVGGIILDSDTSVTACTKLAKYAAAGNTQAIYMIAMILCYCHENISEGLALLRYNASSEDGGPHLPSVYALALILRDSRQIESDYNLNLAATLGYAPAWQEKLTAAEMRAQFGDLDAGKLLKHLDPPCLNRLLGRHYLECRRVRKCQTSHCWNPLCGRWAYKALRVETVRQHQRRGRFPAPFGEGAPAGAGGMERADLFEPANQGGIHYPAAAGVNGEGQAGRKSMFSIEEVLLDLPTKTSADHADASDLSPLERLRQALRDRPKWSGHGLKVSRMKMCSSCRRAKYCSKLCQVYDWRSGRHKMECQFL